MRRNAADAVPPHVPCTRKPPAPALRVASLPLSCLSCLSCSFFVRFAALRETFSFLRFASASFRVFRGQFFHLCVSAFICGSVFSLFQVAAEPEQGRSVWVVLQSLDGKTASGAARWEADGKTYRFRLLPHVSLWRYGTPGAAAEDFRAGDRVLLKLASNPARGAEAETLSALELRDEISEQVRGGHGWQMVSQDADQYRFTVERVDVKTGAALPERLTLAYGRETFLVLRENPVYTFRVSAGTRLWINTGFRPDSPDRMARETLDEESLERFKHQQRLRLLARADASGGRGALVENSLKSTRVHVFPDYAEWARRLQPGDTVRVNLAEAPNAAHATLRIAAVREDAGAMVLTLPGPIPGLKAKQTVAVTPVRERVSYTRDIQPILQVNCSRCHHDGGAQSGFSVSSLERLRARGRRGPGIVPGKSSESLLYLTMSGDRNPHMPPDRDATPEQLALLKKWIDDGALPD
jgi:cytochrome c